MAVQAALEHAIHGIAPNAQINVGPINGKLSGIVIAPEFDDMTHLDRQNAVWNGIRVSMGTDARRVGTLLLYSPEEAGAIEDDPEEAER